ncbi:MAG: sigma-54-dependent Fis family transcriptional regulator [Desulfobacula sp.]|jgi:DNA-binding NtrC family response regulator|uniref:sigma-54-dependent transcriptional regulator n=1 Tax=Desulfobacula sp. TaxID=2593537 RepID=UPI001D4A2FEB|nr:sigma-54-dependent Fis family transcriptional regulator [Desulfobacula sp.]MBT3486500.1 sigma-54-dependent Fis family transcriptional regulator [Desulfobacula sp.]MBT3806428.1 sigma-54-dependent Fis family transcriptional regulator [Desulfobacula sp.]MBT4023904.1 sigma-54-dependent Fis family transcriptional regulator [Desulfobacula sp.]MBT4198970.1 sigma-54-dependent Fis family transcriptional regulator [Desulfobacula sp.]
MKANILAVDDEKDMTRLLQRTLEPEINCSVTMAFSAKMALSILEQKHFDLVICDIRMPGMDGFELLGQIKNNYPDLTVVMLTAFGNIESAVKAIKKGAYDFISKPFDQDEIIFKVQKALERSLLLKENKRLLKEKEFNPLQLIGKSESMQRVYDQISLVASSDVTVLITGESGTGKDLTARSIHALSPRKDKSFIPVNCPTIPENILESELFGYKKGAFTDASRDKDGLFQEADKGTIFLDEIGDIGTSIQTKLLRVLQEKEVKPLGDTKVKKIDVRIIASTNRNLKQKIANHEFREDFFYRLNVLPIELPPLRDRITDIPLLAEHLVTKHCKKLKKKPKKISQDVMDLLMKQPWPGNVRELENILVQGILYSKEKMIDLPDIPLENVSREKNNFTGFDKADINALPYKEAKEKILHEFNHDYIGAKLSVSNGNITRAARQCHMERQALQQIIKRFNINPDNFR